MLVSIVLEVQLFQILLYVLQEDIVILDPTSLILVLQEHSIQILEVSLKLIVLLVLQDTIALVKLEVDIPMKLDSAYLDTTALEELQILNKTLHQKAIIQQQQVLHRLNVL